MAKPITLSNSVVKEADIRLAGDDAEVVVIGAVLDENGDEVKPVVMVVKFPDLPANVRNTLNNAMKQLSREFNVFAADEDSETWSDK